MKYCGDKMSFDTKTQAEAAALVADHQYGTKLAVYRCKYCDLWHVTSNYGDEDDA